jgi:hypothetical protein
MGSNTSISSIVLTLCRLGVTARHRAVGGSCERCSWWVVASIQATREVSSLSRNAAVNLAKVYRLGRAHDIETGIAG